MIISLTKLYDEDHRPLRDYIAHKATRAIPCSLNLARYDVQVDYHKEQISGSQWLQRLEHQSENVVNLVDTETHQHGITMWIDIDPQMKFPLRLNWQHHYDSSNWKWQEANNPYGINRKAPDQSTQRKPKPNKSKA